jgi:hypothetical protein
MTLADLQQWLCDHGHSVLVDGEGGPETREVIDAAFTNPDAPGVSPDDIIALATRLGCTAKQLTAVATVESGRSAFDSEGRPKMLFERHKFNRFTTGRFPMSAWNNPMAGGYGEDSWNKLSHAACQDVDAAFSAASWGRFQVLGQYWQGLGYESPLALAYSTVSGEVAHYELLARYIERFNLKSALAVLSIDPDHNRPFAAAYNGPAFEKFAYHAKLAEAMAS